MLVYYMNLHMQEWAKLQDPFLHSVFVEKTFFYKFNNGLCNLDLHFNLKYAVQNTE